jgi:hypothetical protein
MSNNIKRYPGPDIPRDYEIERHKFRENEHPAVFQTLSRATMLQQEEESLKMAERQPHLRQHQLQPVQQQQQQLPMSSNFSSLADAMKSRFTSGSTASSSNSPLEQGSKHPAGLHWPNPIIQKKYSDQTDRSSSSSIAENAKPEVTVTRTAFSFFPEPLLCKRFGVSPPSHLGKRGDSNTVSVDARRDEATYFEQEILSSVKKFKQSHRAASSSLQQQTANAETKVDNVNDDEEQPEGIDRLPLERLQSIFEAESDGSSSSSSDEGADEEEGAKQEETDKTVDVAVDAMTVDQVGESRSADVGIFSGNVSQALVEYHPRTLANADKELALKARSIDGSSSSSIDRSDSESSTLRRRQKKKKKSSKDKRKKQRKRRRSRSPSREDDRRQRRQKKSKKRVK